mmetsp:Transcript_8940/g.6709  ORF Transcript_8940/g.6709 Transcript_8940/m.6709 type:complete len:82 (+) Transcript_8940:144-389(+)
MQRRLEGLRLDFDQKEMIRQGFKDKKPAQQIYQEVLTSIELKNAGNKKVLKKIKNLAPLYDSHDFWDSQPVPKAYDIVSAD